MSSAYVISSLARLDSSAKVAVPVEVVGAFRQDRATGISGSMADKPSMIPITLRVKSGNDVAEGLARIQVERALCIGVETDILFPLQQQEQIADGLRAGGARTEFLPLPSPQGHDAFLVDIERFGPAVRGFLDTLCVESAP